VAPSFGLPPIPQRHQLEIYFGRFQYVIDKSHRFMIPAEWRDAGAPTQFMIMAWPLESTAPQFLMVLPYERYKADAENLHKYSLTNPRAAEFKRAFGTSSRRAEIDKFGRLALSDSLMKLVGIEDQLEVAGCVDHFELWQPARFEAAVPAAKQAVAEFQSQIFL
jgi:MraZ protein